MQKYIFKLEHQTLVYEPHFSIQDISKMYFDSGGHSAGPGYGVSFKRGDTWGNYLLMLWGMLLRWRKNGLGTGNADLDNKLANDVIMAGIYSLYTQACKHQSSFFKFLGRPDLVDRYKEIRKQVNIYSSGESVWLTTKDVEGIEPIFKEIEKKLGLSKK